MVKLVVTFAAVSALITVTPGPNFLLVLRNGLHGRRPAIATGLGVAIGAIALGIAAAFGLATLLQQSQPLFEVVRLAGALYLCYLGVRSPISAARKDQRSEETSMPGRQGVQGSWLALNRSRAPADPPHGLGLPGDPVLQLDRCDL